MSDYFKKITPDDGAPEFWLVKAIGGVCNNCPAFIDEKTIDYINSPRIR
jgi:hypothetical protein